MISDKDFQKRVNDSVSLWAFKLTTAALE